MIKVILAEDEESLSETLSMFLEDMNCEVVKLKTMHELREIPVPDQSHNNGQLILFLIDQNLPDGSGLDYIENNLLAGKSLISRDQAAIMSGALDYSELEKARRLGCYIFEKPVMYDDLKTWLNVLDKSEG